MHVTVSKGGEKVKNTNKQLENNMIDKRRKFFKLSGITGGGLLLWNFLPKSIFAKSKSEEKGTKMKVSIHPNAISRKEKK